jgi:hypothetical protein
MALANAGAVEIAKASIGEGGFIPLNGSNAHLAVGDSSTAFAASQTDLQAASNKTRKAMESGYPTRSSNQIVLRALYGTGDANYAWNEHGVFNASSSGIMWSRKVESLGTKANTQSWQLTVTITVAAV